jgi:hypothetical protein
MRESIKHFVRPRMDAYGRIIYRCIVADATAH